MRTWKLLVALSAPAFVVVSAKAGVIDIAWNAERRFEHSAEVAPGRFAEICGKLDRGATVRWVFEAGGPLDFNIHYHVGKEVLYPARRSAMRRGAGSLPVALDQDYCWMWTNKAARPVTLKLSLELS
ncbi:hypothetical protein [uncultured Piscinibacter sp.]|uniref:hypothetical protein n=1 Tax=uncultured Piscinibacter sp. TaxID=1131835 RepID=UPI002604C322|nr:hypothetical protein [uncultured Piscinibacter sp.]